MLNVRLCSMKYTSGTHSCYQFIYWRLNCKFCTVGDDGCIKVMESIFVSGVTSCTKVSSPVSINFPILFQNLKTNTHALEIVFFNQLLWDQKLDFCPSHTKPYYTTHFYAYLMFYGSSHLCRDVTYAWTQILSLL